MVLRFDGSLTHKSFHSNCSEVARGHVILEKIDNKEYDSKGSLPV